MNDKLRPLAETELEQHELRCAAGSKPHLAEIHVSLIFGGIGGKR
jgi:hypothetical protein